MSAIMKTLGIDQLSVAERLDLLDEIWDSIAANPWCSVLWDSGV